VAHATLKSQQKIVVPGKTILIRKFFAHQDFFSKKLFYFREKEKKINIPFLSFCLINQKNSLFIGHYYFKI